MFFFPWTIEKYIAVYSPMWSHVNFQSCFFLRHDVWIPFIQDGWPWKENHATWVFFMENIAPVGHCEASRNRRLVWKAVLHWQEKGHGLSDYPPAIKRGKGKSPMNGGLDRKITYKWSIFHGHVWLLEGKGFHFCGWWWSWWLLVLFLSWSKHWSCFNIFP